MCVFAQDETWSKFATPPPIEKAIVSLCIPQRKTYLNAWSRFLIGRVAVAQPPTNLRILLYQRTYYGVHRSLRLDPVVSHLNPALMLSLSVIQRCSHGGLAHSIYAPLLDFCISTFCNLRTDQAWILSIGALPWLWFVVLNARWWTGSLSLARISQSTVEFFLRPQRYDT